MTNDEGRITNDEGRNASDELRIKKGELRIYFALRHSTFVLPLCHPVPKFRDS